MIARIGFKNLKDNRRSLVFWTTGIFAFMVINLALYPDFKDQTQYNDLIESSDAIKAVLGNVKDLTSPEGYMSSQMYTLVLPLMILIYGIGRGVAAIAGEEDRNTLSLLLAQPVSRAKVILGTFWAMKAGIFLLVLSSFLAMWLVGPVYEVDIGVGRLLEASLAVLLLGLVFASVAFLVGAATGNRGLSLGLTGGLATAAYLLNTLAMIVDGLKPYQALSPFYFYNGEQDPLVAGVQWDSMAILLAITIVCFGLSFLAFRRRDIHT